MIYDIINIILLIKMCLKLVYGITFPIWCFATAIMTTIVSSLIIHNKYDTDTCYDGLYNNLNMYTIFITHLIIYLTISFTQILMYILVICNITTEKNPIIFLSNLLSFLGLCLLNGFYLNFLLTNTKNCFENIKLTNFNIYIYFILTYTYSCIFTLILIVKILCYSVI